MKPYILVAVLVMIVAAELFCSFKERQWRVAAENRLAEASACTTKSQEDHRGLQARAEALQAQAGEQQARIKSLQAQVDAQKDRAKTLQAQIDAQQARLETIGKQNREVLDRYVATALKLKAAEAELAQLKAAAAPQAE